ncbi:uncharacterized protein LOC100679747 isoform X1 [Nasonia vitripennis]|uniref:Uncharacterized protein n=1 Tax=Nasonia vitripennis TaxID=7425 RepID=A0A7M7Q8T8_NASVI|nr:uncharacterized protein LOC100679747 isoform X1 [Nasonia vitripennis]XP_031782597.1 uncharacterized protein LOC100679747 isoform X1 [Nasonia vitripennis]XP_031782598.1 uncharacterized protein LOC100679747 isoform X1 [Nasonia vitripennis]XP_032453983.1 uncharacterized protein LOC100679747 isoform X1 [Nasonia vitripennis]XP_032453984.1 uncharacterized protein LOC100679747 isoform X1 [Nasonia vitripennis]XP_032453985.1 uncharacterized protein LOC100679747 isoform X1 [Nasonia vitripennis]
MPESGAVYQPTTVGYAYDTRDGSRLGIRSSFSRIMSRHKFSTRNWLEWVLFSVAVAAFIAGLTTMLVNLVSADDQASTPKKIDGTTPAKDSNTEIKEHSEDGARASIAVGAAMMLLGLLMGFIWAWLRFFRRGKSPRGGMTSNSGQMLGGLNPSTDLLVGSTSQYGPVLTELPSQLKSKQVNSLEVSTAIPMSDQEEETHTLMEDSQQVTGPSTITSQIPG